MGREWRGACILGLLMSNDEDRTLVSRDRAAAGPTLVSTRRDAYATPRAEPTSWNGISYDDIMRSLEDALPPSDRRATMVDAQFAPTRPVSSERAPVTHRMPGRPHAEIVEEHTRLIPRQLHARARVVTTVAPVALRPRHVDLDADVDLGERNAKTPRTVSRRSALDSGPRKRSPKGFVLGAALGMLIAVGGYAYVNPAARTSAFVTADGARARLSTWIAEAKAEGSNDSRAPATAPPPAAARAAPSIASPVAEPAEPPPAMTAAPSVPTMRAPAPPPRRRPAKPKGVDADDSKPAEVDAEPSSLLDRGLGN